MPPAPRKGVEQPSAAVLLRRRRITSSGCAEFKFRRRLMRRDQRSRNAQCPGAGRAGICQSLSIAAGHLQWRDKASPGSGQSYVSLRVSALHVGYSGWMWEYVLSSGPSVKRCGVTASNNEDQTASDNKRLVRYNSVMVWIFSDQSPLARCPRSVVASFLTPSGSHSRRSSTFRPCPLPLPIWIVLAR